MTAPRMTPFVLVIACCLVGFSHSPSRASCKDLGPIGPFMGGLFGGGVTLVASGLGGGISAAMYDDVNGWEVFGVGIGVGVAATLLSAGLLSLECPYPESIWIPPAVALVASTLAMVLFVELRDRPQTPAVNAKPPPPPTSSLVLSF